MRPVPAATPDADVVLYQAADGTISLDVRLARDTVWLSQQQMAELFGGERSVITKHVGNEARARLAVVADYRQALGPLDDYDYQRVDKPASAGGMHLLNEGCDR